MFHGWQHLTSEDRELILRGITDGVVYGGPFHMELDWVDRCKRPLLFSATVCARMAANPSPGNAPKAC